MAREEQDVQSLRGTTKTESVQNETNDVGYDNPAPTEFPSTLLLTNGETGFSELPKTQLAPLGLIST
jgi:hypothetical protein